MKNSKAKLGGCQYTDFSHGRCGRPIAGILVRDSSLGGEIVGACEEHLHFWGNVSRHSGRLDPMELPTSLRREYFEEASKLTGKAQGEVNLAKSALSYHAQNLRKAQKALQTLKEIPEECSSEQ